MDGPSASCAPHKRFAIAERKCRSSTVCARKENPRCSIVSPRPIRKPTNRSIPTIRRNGSTRTAIRIESGDVCLHKTIRKRDRRRVSCSTRTATIRKPRRPARRARFRRSRQQPDGIRQSARFVLLPIRQSGRRTPGRQKICRRRDCRKKKGLEKRQRRHRQNLQNLRRRREAIKARSRKLLILLRGNPVTCFPKRRKK